MTIGIIDSGIGGVAVLKELLRRFHYQIHYIYCSDNRFAPYGSLNEEILAKRIAELANDLTRRGAEAVLLLCNTATAVASESLKKTAGVAVFGVRPDLSAAHGKTLVLSTMLTARTLLRDKSVENGVDVLGLRSLSGEVEAAAPDFQALRPYLQTLLTPYRDAETVLLACTHYIHLAPYVREQLPDAKIVTGTEPLLTEFGAWLREKNVAAGEAEAEFIFTADDRTEIYQKTLFPCESESVSARGRG